MAKNVPRRLLWAVALILLGYLLFFFVFRSWQVLGFPHQVEYGEGPVLGWTRQVAAGQLPYKPMEPFPWDFSVYTPGYFIGSVLLSWAVSPTPWFAGRLLSLLSALGLALLIPLALTGQRTGGKLAWLAAALWLASPYLFRWATFFRPDLFALWWGALGLVLLQQAVAREQRPLVGLAALCFVASFLSKQSFFAAPLAALLYLWWVRRGWVPLLALTGAGAGLVTLGVLWLATEGAVVENLILANANPFSWSALWTFERSFFLTVPVLGLLALGAGWHRLHASPYPAYALLSLLVTISVGKAGAWENYFLEPLWALCVLAGQRLILWKETGSYQKVIPALVLLQLLLFLPALERLTPTAERAWLEGLRTESARLQAVLNTLPHEEPIWSEHMGALAESGRSIPLHSFVYTQLVHQGLWDQSPLVEALAQGRGPLLIQRFDALTDPEQRERWSRAMLDASERGYALGERSGEWLLRPPLPFPPEDAPQPVGEQVQMLNWMVVQGEETVAFPVELKAGEILTVHLLLRSLVEEAVPLTVSVQLFDPSGERVAQHDGPLRAGWLGGAWPAHALLRDEHSLPLPATLPPGGYSLLVTLYESETGAPRGSLTLPRLKVSPPPPDAAPAVPHALRFGEALSLLGHDALPTDLAAGEALTLRAQWRAELSMEQPLTTFLHLVGPDGVLAAQLDLAPPYPVPLWSEGEVVELRYYLEIPTQLPGGSYELYLGWYDAASLERLPVQGNGAANNALHLGQITLP